MILSVYTRGLQSHRGHPWIAGALAAAILLGASLACGGGGGGSTAVVETTVSYTLPGGVALELRRIPAGSFSMGSPDTEAGREVDEGPEHTVTIGRAFYLGKFEVTQAQWTVIVPGHVNPSNFSIAGGGSLTDDLTRPVENVSWDDIQGFLTALNAATAASRPAGMVFRLPTEAEWEYACRGGSATKTRFYWGDDPSYTEADSYAWHAGNSGSSTHGTGELKQSNAFGLYNMSGNVWEWCADDPHADYTGAPADGTPWLDDPRPTNRMMRGGAWNNFGSGIKLRSAYRFDWGCSQRSIVFGLRVVLAEP